MPAPEAAPPVELADLGAALVAAVRGPAEPRIEYDAEVNLDAVTGVRERAKS